MYSLTPNLSHVFKELLSFICLLFFLMEEDQKPKLNGHFSVTFLRRSHQVFSCLVTYCSQVMHAVVYLNFMKATIIHP